MSLRQVSQQMVLLATIKIVVVLLSFPAMVEDSQWIIWITMDSTKIKRSISGQIVLIGIQKSPNILPKLY